MSGCADESKVAGESVADDWENIAGDQVQQLTNERLNFAEQQKQASAMEQQIMNEKGLLDNDGGLPSNMVNKPIKLLKREQPMRKRVSESESKEEVVQSGNMSIDERKANYDKIRERIFAAASVEKEAPVPEDPKKSPTKPVTNPPDASTSNDVMIETINYLSNVQMLSEQTPQRQRQAPVLPPPWIPPPRPQELRSIPPLAFLPPVYGMPPPQPLSFVPPPDFSRPPPPSLPFSSKNQVRQKYNH